MQAQADPAEIASCFEPYRPKGWTANLALRNLEAKLNDDRFTTDLSPFVAQWPPEYRIEQAAEIATQIINAAT